MKKSYLFTGFVYVIVGICFLVIAIISETKLDGILWGFSGACIMPGLGMIVRYFYWNSPSKKEEYKERMENEQIEMHDELKVMIRDKAGRYTYNLSFLVLCLIIFIVGILGSFELIENVRLIIIILSLYLLFQIVAGIIIFNKLLKKY